MVIAVEMRRAKESKKEDINRNWMREEVQKEARDEKIKSKARDKEQRIAEEMSEWVSNFGFIKKTLPAVGFEEIEEKAVSGLIKLGEIKSTQEHYIYHALFYCMK